MLGEFFSPAAIFPTRFETGCLALAYPEPQWQRLARARALLGERRLGRVPAENAALSLARLDPLSISFFFFACNRRPAVARAASCD